MSSFAISKEQQLKYLNRRSTDIDDLKSCLLKDDLEAATMIGHRLKGSGQTFGFPLITEHGSIIEIAGRDRDKKRVADSVSELEKIIQDYLAKIHS